MQIIADFDIRLIAFLATDGDEDLVGQTPSVTSFRGGGVH
jgi:hypothetical protein